MCSQLELCSLFVKTPIKESPNSYYKDATISKQSLASTPECPPHIRQPSCKAPGPQVIGQQTLHSDAGLRVLAKVSTFQKLQKQSLLSRVQHDQAKKSCHPNIHQLQAASLSTGRGGCGTLRKPRAETGQSTLFAASSGSATTHHSCLKFVRKKNQVGLQATCSWQHELTAACRAEKDLMNTMNQPMLAAGYWKHITACATWTGSP